MKPQPALQFCGRCDNGWIWRGNETTPCDCMDNIRSIRRVNRVMTGLPKLYLENAAELDRRPVLDLAPELQKVLRHYARNLERFLDVGKGLWFYGPHATGKTSAAIALAKEARRRGRTIGFHVTPNVLDRLRAAAHDDDQHDAMIRLVEQLTALDLLVLDDLGAEAPTKYAVDRFYRILNDRYLERRAVIVTSNLDPEALADRLGGQIVSRLFEMCEQPLLFDGPDNRHRRARSWIEVAQAE
jgi:DNA replication protein DnaC